MTRRHPANPRGDTRPAASSTSRCQPRRRARRDAAPSRPTASLPSGSGCGRPTKPNSLVNQSRNQNRVRHRTLLPAAAPPTYRPSAPAQHRRRAAAHQNERRQRLPRRWDLPGGTARQGETAPIACQRLGQARTGLHILPPACWSSTTCRADGRPGRRPRTSSTASGPPERSASDRTSPPPAGSPPHEVERLVTPHLTWRIECTLDAINGAPVRYLYGHPRD